jgi:arsenite methyltransferase
MPQRNASVNGTVADAPTDVEGEVLRRYAEASERVEPALCCPSGGYDPSLTEHIPGEILEKDYGCGDPTRWVGRGETVVDLGCGVGKACYMLSKKVGPDGRVIGVDFNDAMLAVARKHQEAVAARLGFANVRFVKAKIQDMALDSDPVEAWLRANPVRTVQGLARLEAACSRLRREQPAVASGSVDAVVSNCVLNLVKAEDKSRLFSEIRRVLRPGGRAVISDIVCDEDPTTSILNDPQLWSGCIAGAFREDAFLEHFEEAGFYGVQVLARQEEPWREIDGVQFRALTVRAYKGEEGPCLERNQAVVYRGPWKSVRDDDGHTLLRGKRMAVCDKTYRIMTDPRGPYAQDVIGIPPLEDVPPDSAAPFDCRSAAVRDPRQAKGGVHQRVFAADDGACRPGGECC